jgi:hypothetical protein
MSDFWNQVWNWNWAFSFFQRTRTEPELESRVFKESESDPGLEPGANQQLTAGFGPGYLDLGLIFRTGTGVGFFFLFLKKQTQNWN